MNVIRLNQDFPKFLMRLFLHWCRRHLFAHIHLSSGKSTGQSQRIARKAKNLNEIFVKVPEIANYVQKMFFTVSNFNNTEVHIVSQLLLQFSMINKLSLSVCSPCDWALVAPELQSVISCLASIKENPNSKFSLISEIFGEITSNFHRLGQITPLSKLRRITLYEYGS